MSEELKPCPHCGSKGAEVVFDTVVLCSGCTAEAQPSDWNRRAVTPAQVKAAAEALRRHGLGCDSGVTLADHPRALYLRRAARCANIATIAFRAAGFEVDELRHILPATISKLKTEE